MTWFKRDDYLWVDNKDINFAFEKIISIINDN